MIALQALQVPSRTQQRKGAFKVLKAFLVRLSYMLV